jgi:hypothetical protein
MLAAVLALAAPAVAQDLREITACGKLTKPGNYEVGNITATTGGDCLVIDGPNISLGGITPSYVAGTGTGIGVHFTRRAKHSSMFTSEEWGINGFTTGIKIEGNGVQLRFNYSDNLVILNCTDGIEINGAKNVVIGEISGFVPGIDINVAQIGVLVVGHSSFDTIIGTANQVGLEIPPIGIQVNRSASHITVESNSTQGALVDKHKNCRTDTWQNDTFVSANQSCIQ